MRFNIKIEDSVEYELPDGVADDEEMAIETALEFWAMRDPVVTIEKIEEQRELFLFLLLDVVHLIISIDFLFIIVYNKLTKKKRSE